MKIKVIALLSIASFKVIALDNCPNALNACIELSKQQDVSITMLKKEVATLEDKVVQEEKTVPWWTYVLLGVVGGFTIDKLLK